MPVTIAVVGKYTNLSDAYLSVTKALYHAANKAERKLVVSWVEAEFLSDDQVDIHTRPHLHAHVRMHAHAHAHDVPPLTRTARARAAAPHG